MTAGPVVAPGDVEARLAEVLAGHASRERRYEDRHSWGFCRCGWESSGPFDTGHRAHVAAVLAPIVAGEVARAVEAAVVRVEGERNRDWQEHLRLHPLSDSKSCPYDYGKHDAYARAARIVREAKP